MEWITIIIIQGLQVDDQIAGFGSVTADNFNSLQDIANVVHNSLGVRI